MLKLFSQSCHMYGVPSRVRCDRGGENLDVALFMSLVRGSGRGSVIAGRSVHNQRIERMWRDVATQVTEFFYNLFYSFEDEHLLDLDNRCHISALHVVFLPLINIRMLEFRSAWNNHRLRTEANRTPIQLWLTGMLQNINSSHAATVEIFEQQPSLDTRVEDALRNFNVDIEQFSPSRSAVQPQVQRHEVDDTAVANINQLTENITDLRQKFITAIQYIEQVTQ